MADVDPQGRWEDIDKLLSRESPFQGANFQPDNEEDPMNKEFLLQDSKILVIGAGGLGCELLKDLTLVGFRNIEVIDMDRIDLSNLNRQFLFRQDDVGKPKAEVASAFINKRVPGAKVVGHFAKIQDKDLAFYEEFNLIIAGLDSIPARRWINSLLVNMVETDEDGNVDSDTIIPLIDGGTEGFKGQARVILPPLTSCFECSLETFPPQTNFPMCTVRHTPRQPEHCIQYALVINWENEQKIKLDKDNMDHMKWIYEKALERAKQYNIPGVTFRLTQGVVKNIIPAIASTNAVIAAATANEAFKIATNTAGYLNNWMAYNGLLGVYTNTFKYEQKASCPVCGNQNSTYEADPLQTLNDLVEDLCANPNYQLMGPSIMMTGEDGKRLNLWSPRPEGLAAATKPNLSQPLKALFSDGDTLDITDPTLFSVAINLKVNFSKPPGSFALSKEQSEGESELSANQ